MKAGSVWDSSSNREEDDEDDEEPEVEVLIEAEAETVDRLGCAAIGTDVAERRWRHYGTGVLRSWYATNSRRLVYVWLVTHDRST